MLTCFSKLKSYTFTKRHTSASFFVMCLIRSLILNLSGGWLDVDLIRTHTKNGWICVGKGLDYVFTIC